MSQYLVLIYGDPTYEAGSSDDVMKGHMKFGEDFGSKIAGGNALQPTSTATSIRPDGAGFAVTDGPFLETKEALGGYYLIEAADLDEAITISQGIPMPAGGVEIRPVVVYG
ncbi:MAG: YCII-related protein [Frankiales bacterium]|jgi:hypothetical protein|nr:YCII-related protein [Frankiales bacterium]